MNTPGPSCLPKKPVTPFITLQCQAAILTATFKPSGHSAWDYPRRLSFACSMKEMIFAIPTFAKKPAWQRL
jgi:hypothetical protein